MAGNRVVEAVGPSYTLADRKAAIQRAVNLYLSAVEGPTEDRPAILRSCPGLLSYISAGAVIRGSYNADGRWFVAAGSTLYEVVSGALVSRGALHTNTGYVGMAHGLSQLVVVDGVNGYVLTLSTNSFADITSSGWLGSDDVGFLDGYFTFVDPDTEQFYISAIDDGSSLDALDFSSADTQPDNILTHRVFKREAYFFGTRSIEVWINSGESSFPLTRYNATPVQVGVCGKRAVCIAADTVLFVGSTDRGEGYVYQIQGYQPVRISTQAVEESLAGATLSECRMWSYHEAGNEFVGIEAPGMSTTWVWNAATGFWHEQARLSGGVYSALDIDLVTFFEGAHYCAYGSTLYRLDAETYTLGGDVLSRERTWPHLIAPSMEPVNYRGLELKCTTGTGGLVTLEVSNNGGYQWGTPLPRELGADGQYNKRVRWLGLGAANDRVFRVRCTSAVPFSIYAATLDAS